MAGLQPDLPRPLLDLLLHECCLGLSPRSGSRTALPPSAFELAPILSLVRLQSRLELLPLVLACSRLAWWSGPYLTQSIVGHLTWCIASWSALPLVRLCGPTSTLPGSAQRFDLISPIVQPRPQLGLLSHECCLELSLLSCSWTAQPPSAFELALIFPSTRLQSLLELLSLVPTFSPSFLPCSPTSTLTGPAPAPAPPHPPSILTQSFSWRDLALSSTSALVCPCNSTHSLDCLQLPLPLLQPSPLGKSRLDLAQI
jgi:hypothetical protein